MPESRPDARERQARGEQTAEGIVRSYYEALREGAPLEPFFGAGEGVVKYGISERLVGGDAVGDGLREQTASTHDWTVESHALRVTEYDDHAWFSDRVTLAWTDDETGERHEYGTRWSGTLERRDPGGVPDPSAPWRFVGMHVSTADEI